MKPEAILKKLGKHAHATLVGPYDIDIRCLVTDPTFQPRTRTDKSNVGRLKGAYKSGGDVPPITVAVLIDRDQALVVMDGHHRLEAKATILAEMQRTGFVGPWEISARFVRLTTEQARWQAAEANMRHGKPMTNAEVKRGFARFIEAGLHLGDGRQYRSLREMGRVFSKDHKTISSWLHSMFPKLAAEMLTGETANTGGEGKPAPVRVAHQEVDAALSGVRNLFEELPSGARHEMVQKLSQLTSDFERQMAATCDFDHDQTLGRPF